MANSADPDQLASSEQGITGFSRTRVKKCTSMFHLMLSLLVKTFSRRHFEISFLLSLQKIAFDISCKLSMETICMKCQSKFSEKIKKCHQLLYVELAQRVVKVKLKST